MPHLNPFPGPCSVVILDGASIHHDRRVAEAIHATGAVIYHLPPYSPDVMPAEFVFAKTKAKLLSFGPHATEVRHLACNALPSAPPCEEADPPV